MCFEERFSKGKYYIGDPCYVIKEQKEWIDLWNSTNGFENEKQFYRGKKILAANTSTGDGIYEDNLGNSYCVDSGTIGIIPIEVTDQKYSNIEDLGSIIEFEEDFTVEIEDGVFKFDNITIDTGEEEEEYCCLNCGKEVNESCELIDDMCEDCYNEAYKECCKNCGEEFDKEDLVDGLCINCREEE